MLTRNVFIVCSICISCLLTDPTITKITLCMRYYILFYCICSSWVIYVGNHNWKTLLERWKLKWIFGENAQKQSLKTFSSGSLSFIYFLILFSMIFIVVVTSFSICSKMNFHFGYKIWCDDKNQVTKINKQYHGVKKCESPLTVRSNKMIWWCEQWPFFIFTKRNENCVYNLQK